MHRWFRFSTAIALVLFSMNSFAEESPAQAATPSKRKPKSSLLANLEELVEQQSKQIEELSKKIDQGNLSLEQQSKRIEEQNAKIDTLGDQITRLNTTILAISERESQRSAPLAAPAFQPAAPAPVVETAPPAAISPVEPPNPNAPASHTIKRGENLTSIARQHGTTVAELLKINKIEDERKLQIGQTLILPSPASATPSPSATTAPHP